MNDEQQTFDTTFEDAGETANQLESIGQQSNRGEGDGDGAEYGDEVLVKLTSKTVRTDASLAELLDSLSKVWIRAFRGIELDYGGSTVLHDSFP